MGGGPPALKTHQYKGFVIAIYTIPKLNGQFSTMSGIRKAGAPIPREPFPLSEQEFSTREDAAKAALDECMKKIDAVWARHS